MCGTIFNITPNYAHCNIVHCFILQCAELVYNNLKKYNSNGGIIITNNFEGLLRRLRKKRGLTLKELSKLTGYSHSYLSQLERGERGTDGIPSNDVLHKLSEPLNISHFDLMVAAGYYTDEELQQRKEIEEYYKSKTPEQKEEDFKEEMKYAQKIFNIEQYQERFHVRIEDFLNDERKSFYIDDHKLTHEDIKMLITLYGGKEKNYPSDEQIEKEYEEIKSYKDESNKKSAKAYKEGKIHFDMAVDYDINTNEGD